jgi:hypothetical protein
MFIKTIVKTDRNTSKSYNYYRLCEGYRIGNKVRHRSILSLGKLEGIDSKEDKKFLADRIESLVKRESLLFSKKIKPEVEKYAQKFAKRIIDEKLLDTTVTSGEVGKTKPNDYQTIDLNSIEHPDVRELGAEWLCKQTLDKLELRSLLCDKSGFSEPMANMALMHIISRAVYPASEHKTADWIQGSSSISGLCNVPLHTVNRFKLYQASKDLYQYKDTIEKHLSTRTNELFDLQDKIIFYDLTNTYFEGRKAGSKLAKFGRSKEKRSDAKIVALATVINAEGFLKYSRIYQGNISDSKTLEKTINELSLNTSNIARKPVIVMDAGIVTEDNTIMLKAKGYDYICVSRTKLKDYKQVKANKEVVTISDNRNNPLELKLVEKPGCPDTYLHVRSQQKAVKEASMNEHFSQRYEEDLENIREALHKKGGIKKLDKVHERIGRLKERYPTANKHYKIEVTPDQEKDKAIDLKWKKTPVKPKSEEGIYFIRTCLNKEEEKTLWTIYNTLTEIEATFRILKTDLLLRPVFHKTDENVEAHLFLGLLAYQIVATIRHQLKAKNINHDWKNIVRIMNTQKEVTTSMKSKSEETIHIKKCSAPSAPVKEIYDALQLKHQPYFMKKSVVPE